MHCSQGIDVEKTAGDKTTIFGVPLTGRFNRHQSIHAGLHEMRSTPPADTGRDKKWFMGNACRGEKAVRFTVRKI
jgi:hypothetical protein